MEKRDLKADLEQVRNFRSKWRQSTSLKETWDIGVAWEYFCRENAELWLEQALAEKERADKYEEAHGHAIDILNKIGSMVKEVREIAEYDYSDYANGQVDLCNVIGNLVATKCLLVAIEDTLSKKKEALGDE